MAPSLPTEIIQLILHELHPDASDSVTAALYVSAISRHWRAVTLSMPSLWATFSFCLRTCQEAMLSTFLERSLPKPLNLTISFDFSSSAHVDTPKIQRALTLFIRAADRLESLRLCFLTPMHDQSNLLGPLMCFQSTGLKSLEMDFLNSDKAARAQLIRELNLLVTRHTQTWSERCPALTHVGCTDPRLLVNVPFNMTHLCIKGESGSGPDDSIPASHAHAEEVGTFLRSFQVPALASLMIQDPDMFLQ